MTEIPRNQPESEVLEFKGAEKIDDLDGIAIGLVALLNADRPSQFWIGLAEDPKTGMAERIEPVPNVHAMSERLWNHLVDKLEPRPTEKELRREEIPAGNGGAILCIHVNPNSAQRPYAYLGRSNSRLYARRVGARRVTLSREELQQAFARRDLGADQVDQAAKRAREKLERILADAVKLPETTLLLALQPAWDLTLDLQDPQLKRLLREPHGQATNLRRNVPILPSGEPALTRGADALQTGVRIVPSNIWIERSLAGVVSDEQLAGLERLPQNESDLTATRIDRDGGLVHRRPIFTFEAGAGPSCLARRIDPIEFIALVVYWVRFAGEYLRRVSKEPLPEDKQVLVDVCLTRLTGWTLLPGSPGGRQYIEAASRWDRTRDRKELSAGPLECRATQILERPDHCAWTIVRRLYERFGHWEADIPEVFDPSREHYLGPS